MSEQHPPEPSSTPLPPLESRSAQPDEALAGGGEMGALIRSMDWSRTALGPTHAWPQSLRTAVSICLGSRFPYLIIWGEGLVQIYNDAFRPILGPAKHPQALGLSARETWPEVWNFVGPMVEGSLLRGEASWVENQLFLFDRGDRIEEIYLTFSHSPIRDETGKVGGIFQAVSDVTRGVLGARRLSTLRSLIPEARSLEDAARACLDVLGTNLSDVPFAALYRVEGGGQHASLLATSGMTPGSRLAPTSVPLAGPLEAGQSPWPFAPAIACGERVQIDGLGERFGADVPEGPWPERPPSALVLPLSRSGRGLARGADVGALLVLGVSARLRLDAEYLNFFELVAGHVATVLASARAYEEERRRAEALRRLDEAKTTFFSNISHEFRTPLTLILGPLEDLLSSDRLGEEESRELRVIHRNAGRLLRLVNSLLDFSRLEAGRARAAFEPTDLALFTTDLASAFRSAADKAGLRLVVDCPPLSRPVPVDRDMWEKIVLNLLSNALKFTFEGEIRVSLREEAGRARLRVEDSGTGISASELPHVFERFHRVQGARSRSHEGTGIGLSLVRELVLLHDGEVGVRSTEGQGTCFTVEVPLEREQETPARPLPAGSPESTATRAALFVDEALRWSEAPRAPGAGPAPGRGRVLLADDNADMRDYVRRILAAAFEVETVADGEEALAAAHARPFDLVLTDVMMPRLGGFGLLRALREAPATRTLPVIMLSARAGEEAAVEGLEAGADDYLVKPFSARELLARVRSNLELSRMRHALTRQEAFAAGLQESLRARDEFLSAASHELKTPLAAFRLQLELIERGLTPDNRLLVGERILQAGKHVHRLARLVEMMLDVSELMSGRCELRLEETDLTQLLSQTVSRMGEELRHAECPVRLQADSPLLRQVDRRRLALVVENLLHNATKYGMGKPIELTLTRDEHGTLHLGVVDHGLGISAEDKHRVFDRFERAVSIRRYGGLGLGLWVTRQWVEAHGGRISVEDTPGGGATFQVELPEPALARA